MEAVVAYLGFLASEPFRADGVRTSRLIPGPDKPLPHSPTSSATQRDGPCFFSPSFTCFPPDLPSPAQTLQKVHLFFFLSPPLPRPRLEFFWELLFFGWGLCFRTTFL